MDFNNTNNQNQNQNNNPYPGNNPYPNNNPYGSPFPNQPGYTPPRKTPADGMITASVVLGVAAIVSAFMMTVYFPFILGGISIILALLSKGQEQKMASKARMGIICSIVGLVLNVIIVVGSVCFVFANKEAYQQFDQMYEYIYGESFSDTYEKLTGQEFIY